MMTKETLTDKEIKEAKSEMEGSAPECVTVTVGWRKPDEPARIDADWFYKALNTIEALKAEPLAKDAQIAALSRALGLYATRGNWSGGEGEPYKKNDVFSCYDGYETAEFALKNTQSTAEAYTASKIAEGREQGIREAMNQCKRDYEEGLNCISYDELEFLLTKEKA